ncbi:hypothetical protein P43SY_000204 [Pythium insidiosum]|uniref:PHD-type domain-containing protein n=1 Tax=Pythium insidiosum TaxID=114742 RepID=A0AAD5QC89_PYTIN|nr:hypothetical protein P43SY_000204 [Pythium insidiosum]
MHRPSKAAAYRFPAAPLTEDRLEEEEAQEIEMVDSEDEEREERGQDQRHQHDGHHWGGLALPPFKRRRLAVQQPPMYELSVMAERQMAELEGLIRRAQEVTRLASPPAELSCPPSLAKEIAVARRTAAALFGCQDLVEGVSPEASVRFINNALHEIRHVTWPVQTERQLETIVGPIVQQCWLEAGVRMRGQLQQLGTASGLHEGLGSDRLSLRTPENFWSQPQEASTVQIRAPAMDQSAEDATQLDKALKTCVKRSVWTDSHTAKFDKAPERSVWTDSHTAKFDKAPERSVWTSSHTAQLDNSPNYSTSADRISCFARASTFGNSFIENDFEQWTGCSRSRCYASENGCFVCHRNDQFASLLLCDNECGREFHTQCLTPPVANIPHGNWFCPQCMSMEGLEQTDLISQCILGTCSKITRSKYCSSHRCQDEASAVSLSSLALSAKEENDRPEAIIMSARSSRESPESSADAPSFTCEVCKISVRSAQKLLDHVNFSPLHKAALEGGAGGHHAALSPSGKGRSGHRRLIYDGTKLFWRINETLELCIYEDTGANCVAVTAFTQQESDEVKIAPLQLDRRSVLKAAAADPKQPHIKTAATGPLALPPDVISKYLLARLQAKKETRNGVSVITLGLQKLPDDEVEPVLLAHGAASLVPSDLNVRRRHTFDDVKTAQKQVKEAAVELKQARQQAENLSNLARLTLEAFSKRGNSSHSPTRQSRTDWLRVYDRVSLQTAVAHNKDVLQHVGRSHPESPVKHK